MRSKEEATEEERRRRRRQRDAEPKTKTPHNDVGKYAGMARTNTFP